MAPGDTSQGVRCPDVEDPTEWHDTLPEGGYRKAGGVWHVRPPGFAREGSIGKHEVTEHEDGAITVSPSILIECRWAGEVQRWHGYLERGVWKEAE